MPKTPREDLSGMSPTAVALTPADQAAQYLKCGTTELAALIKANGGTLHRVDGHTYCTWDDVNALKEARQPAAARTSRRPRAASGSSTGTRTGQRRTRRTSAQTAPAATKGRSTGKASRGTRVTSEATSEAKRAGTV